MDVAIVDDNNVQNNRTATVSITSAVLDRPFPLPSESLTGTTEFEMTIVENDDLRFVRVLGNRNGIEPNGTQSPTLSARFEFKIVTDGTTNLNFPATLPQSTTITYEVFGVQTDATAGTDFTAPNGSITIPANQSSVFLDVAVLQDNLVETDERISLRITGLSHTNIDVHQRSWGTVRITDEDTATVSVDPFDADVTEGRNTGSFRFTLSRPSATQTVVTYDHEQVGGFFNFLIPRATPGVDFIEMPGEVVFAPMVTSVDQAFTALSDTTIDDNELAIVQIRSIQSGDEDISIAQAGFPVSNDLASVLIKDAPLIIVIPTPPINPTNPTLPRVPLAAASNVPINPNVGWFGSTASPEYRDPSSVETNLSPTRPSTRVSLEERVWEEFLLHASAPEEEGTVAFSNSLVDGALASFEEDELMFLLDELPSMAAEEHETSFGNVKW